MRTYRFVFGTPVALDGTVVNIQQKVDTSKDNAYQIENGLQIEFQVVKDNTEKSNKSYVTIYNLPDFIVDYLKINIDKSLSGLLEAGYDGTNYQLFCGTIEYFEDSWDDKVITRTTKFIFGDASQNLSKCNAARSYRAGTPIITVIKDLAADLQLPIGRIVGISGTLDASVSFSGNTAQNLTNICTRYGANFSVQDGAVYVTKTGKRFEQNILYISPDTGLVGTPSPKQPTKNKKSKEKNDASQEDVGLEVKIRLYGPIIPESTIYLDSLYYKGFYKVVRLEHNGTYEGGDWITKLTVVETTGTLV